MREALLAYFKSDDAKRPQWIDQTYKAQQGIEHGDLILPAEAGSAFLVSADGATLRLSWEAAAKEGQDRALQIPVGTYTVKSFRYYKQDDKGAWWTLSATSPKGCAKLAVVAGKATQWPLPSLARGEVKTAQRGGAWMINVVIQSEDGSRVTVSREGVLMPVKFTVVDGAGTEVDSGTAQYG